MSVEVSVIVDGIQEKQLLAVAKFVVIWFVVEMEDFIWMGKCSVRGERGVVNP